MTFPPGVLANILRELDLQPEATDAALAEKAPDHCRVLPDGHLEVTYRGPTVRTPPAVVRQTTHGWEYEHQWKVDLCHLLESLGAVPANVSEIKRWRGLSNRLKRAIDEHGGTWQLSGRKGRHVLRVG